MKTVCAILFTASFLCMANSQPVRFSLSDTLKWDDGITSGQAHVLRVDKTIIDTVDGLFGVQAIDKGGLIYRKVSIDVESKTTDRFEGFKDHYVLWRNGHRNQMGPALKYFDEWFSSPSVIESRIYYWGLKRSKSADTISVYAMWYDFATNETESLFLFSDMLETDNPGFFFPPKKMTEGIRFEYEYRGWIVDFASKIKKALK